MNSTTCEKHISLDGNKSTIRFDLIVMLQSDDKSLVIRHHLVLLPFDSRRSMEQNDNVSLLPTLHTLFRQIRQRLDIARML